MPRYYREGNTLISLVDLMLVNYLFWGLPFLFLFAVIIGTFVLSRRRLLIDAEGPSDNNTSCCFSLVIDPIELFHNGSTHLDSLEASSGCYGSDKLAERRLLYNGQENELVRVEYEVF